MTPKERAKELVNRFLPKQTGVFAKKIYIQYAKECALICVDEILSLNYPHKDIQEYYEHIKYLKEVKQEILKL